MWNAYADHNMPNNSTHKHHTTLMVQKSGNSDQLVGRFFSLFTTGFIHPTSGCFQDFWTINSSLQLLILNYLRKVGHFTPRNLAVLKVRLGKKGPDCSWALVLQGSSWQEWWEFGRCWMSFPNAPCMVYFPTNFPSKSTKYIYNRPMDGYGFMILWITWWWQLLNIFKIFTPILGEMIPNLTSIIFFKWVGEKPPTSRCWDVFYWYPKLHAKKHHAKLRSRDGGSLVASSQPWSFS